MAVPFFFSYCRERVAVSHTFGRGKRLVNERISAALPSDDRRFFIRFRANGGFVILFRHIVLDDWRLFIRFRTSGGSAYVWERKTPRKRASFRHSFEAGGQMAVSLQNTGEESIAERAYKRNVEEAPLSFDPCL